MEHDDSFDDVWKLKLSEMQLQNSRFEQAIRKSSNHRTIFTGVRNYKAVYFFIPKISNGPDFYHDGVTINTVTGDVRGCNNFVNLSSRPIILKLLQD